MANPKKKSAPKKRKAGSAVKAWSKAAKLEGYMKKGEGFKPLPKKGTKEYKKIRARYEKMIKK